MTQVSELTGRKLDEWVARAEGHHVAKYLSDGGPDILAVTDKITRCTRIIDGGTAFEWLRHGAYHPSADFKTGGPIMAAMLAKGLMVRQQPGGDVVCSTADQECIPLNPADPKAVFMTAPDVLTAAMRVRVALAYGDEVPA